jgi:hypothetical protein
MVRPERFELPTYCSGGNRSIHLSYGRTPVVQVYMWTEAGSIGGNTRTDSDDTETVSEKPRSAGPGSVGRTCVRGLKVGKLRDKVQ